MSMGWMRAAWPFVRLSLLGRRTRSTLLALAITLSSAMVVAVVVLTSAGQAAVSGRIDRSVGTTDAIVAHQFGADFDDAMLEEVAAWPGVATAGGRLRESITLAPADGRRDDEGRLRRITVECRGFDLASAERFDQIEFVAGRLPTSPFELVIDPLTAQRIDVGIGDRLEVQRFGDPVELEVVGIQKRPILGALQRPTGHLDRGTLAEATGSRGRVSVISLILDEDVDVVAWCQERQALLGESSDLVVEPSERIRSGFDRTVAGAELGLTLGSILAFLSCSFIVATGMTTAVVEQQRLLAITRCLGARRGSMVLGQLLAGGLLGAAGGVLGIPLGLGLASLAPLGAPDVLTEGVALRPLAVVLALAGSTGAGLIGALWPAIQAGRVPPLEAMRARAHPPRPRLMLLCLVLGLGGVGLPFVLRFVPDIDTQFHLYSFVGMPLLHVGWFLLAAPLFAAIAAVAAGPLERLLGLPGRVLVGSVRATPFRFGFISGALMVGLSVLVSTWSNGVAIEESVKDRMRFADGFVFQTGGLSLVEQERIANLPGVLDSCPVGYLPVEMIGEQAFGLEELGPPNVIAVGFDPTRFNRLNRLEWVAGDPDTALMRLEQGDGVLVAEQFLTARGLGVGDRITLGKARRNVEFEIVGVVGAAGLDIATQLFGMRSLYNEQALNCVFLNMDTVGEVFGTREAFILQLQLDDSLGPLEELALGEQIVSAAPGSVFATGRAIREIIDQVATTMLGVATTIAGGALLLAALGVGNVIAAGIAARRFEFGLMRAVGADHGTVARLVIAEAVLVAGTAAIVGAGLGMQLAWMGAHFYRELVGIDLAVEVPVTPLVIGCLVLVCTTLLASTPAALGLMRRSTVQLLSAGRAG